MKSSKRVLIRAKSVKLEAGREMWATEVEAEERSIPITRETGRRR